MSITNKNVTNPKRFYCDVCKLNISTEAEYALHEFSKKHCDNLVRIAKNKPIISKQKAAKSESLGLKEEQKINVATSHGNFAKYGYFVPGEIYDTRFESKEFNTEYDPYKQKFAENPQKEIVHAPPISAIETPTLPTANITSFKRKKKKVRACQICNVTLLTVPEYEAHMRSPQHTRNLKISGMGVSAHFVKASTDLHTIEINEDSTSNENYDFGGIESDATVESIAMEETTKLFPTLYCDICELLLNSEQQYNAHVNGKSHNENVVRKAEHKAKKLRLENPNPNQLYCYSCKVALNNLYQYNEHKFGKKHKARCRKLMIEGITIPPEERVASWGTPKLDPNKPVIYPEMYEKCVLESQRLVNSAESSSDRTKGAESNFYISDNSSCLSNSNGSKYNEHRVKCDTYPKYSKVNQQETPCPDPSVPLANRSNLSESSYQSVTACGLPRMVFHGAGRINSDVYTCADDHADSHLKSETENGARLVSSFTESQASEGVVNDNLLKSKETYIDNEVKMTSSTIKLDDIIKCCICNETFTEQIHFEHHLLKEEHAIATTKMRVDGVPENEILGILMRDRAAVKPNKSGSYTCGICSITARNVSEFHHHLCSVLHKQSEEDYRMKREVEIKSAIVADEKGEFSCKLCKEGFCNILQFNRHLHTMKHRDGVKYESSRKTAASKRALILQQRRLKHKYIISGLKRKDFACWRRNCEKNPGLRPKITGMVTDSQAGFRDRTPNLRITDPKINDVNKTASGVSGEEGPTNQPERKGLDEVYRPPIKSLLSISVENPFAASPIVESSRYERFMRARNWAPYPTGCHFRQSSLSRRGTFLTNRYQPHFPPPWCSYSQQYR